MNPSANPLNNSFRDRLGQNSARKVPQLSNRFAPGKSNPLTQTISTPSLANRLSTANNPLNSSFKDRLQSKFGGNKGKADPNNNSLGASNGGDQQVTR